MKYKYEIFSPEAVTSINYCVLELLEIYVDECIFITIGYLPKSRCSESMNDVVGWLKKWTV